MTARVEVGDVVAWARAYDGPPFHAMLCDPPYELGFMGKDWDASGVAFHPETWAALASVLHPGGFGMAFASSRGWHRLAVAIEDAGLVIHPSVFGWTYGSGFPKATRIDTAIDKAAGAEREVVGERDVTRDFREVGRGSVAEHGIDKLVPGIGSRGITIPVTAPATPLAAAWAGHRYGLQALKPALEPIIVFQRPYAGRPVDSITATGAGALWIDGGRVPTGEAIPAHHGTNGAAGHTMGARAEYVPGSAGTVFQTAGRWPANFYLQHTPACNGVCADGCPVAALGAQSGERPGAVSNGRTQNGSMFDIGASPQRPGHADTGTAARFFHNPDWSLDVAEALAAADPVRYVAKASRAERNAGCEGLAERPCGTMEDDGYAWAGEIARGRQPRNATRRNPHPTVKPLALARHLATLLLPPDAYAPRRLFVPFAGSGSEMIGARLAGWEEVVGVELSDEYAEIARARLAWWEANAPDDAARQPALPMEATP